MTAAFKHPLKSLLVAMALTPFVTMASASEYPVTFRVDSLNGSAYWNTTLSPDNRLTWDWSPTLMAAANAINGISVSTGDISAQAPGAITISKTGRGQLTSLQWRAPLTEVTATADSAQYLSPPRPQLIQASGSLAWQTSGDDITNSGGHLAISNLTVDLASGVVRADVLGENGVGLNKQVNVFTLQNPGSPTASTTMPCFMDGPEANLCTPLTLEGRLGTLVPTTDFQAMAAQSLGLLDAGKAALEKASNWGTLGVTAVPEPSSMLMMGLGLSALIALRRKA